MNPFALAAVHPPPDLLIEPVVRRALEEDLGRGGDMTSELAIPSGHTTNARLVARQAGTVSGLVVAACVLRLFDGTLRFRAAISDGERAPNGATIATIEGAARSILATERVALNFVGHLSGIATATRALVEAVEGTKARIVCTRKTTPGLRLLEKYAVRCGGGFNHRFGLDDAILIKDNHVVAAGGIGPAIERVRSGAGHMIKIEVEVDTLKQLEEALSLGIDTVLLDNMELDQIRRAVALTNGRAVIEASGSVTLSGVREIAETGVDYISSGFITHSAPNLDVALDF